MVTPGHVTPDISAKAAHVLSPEHMLIMLRDAPDNGVDGMLGCSS